MIDIINDMVDLAKKVDAFGKRVYRAYPQLVDRMEPFAVINPAGRAPVLTDSDGSEIIVNLSYTVTIFEKSPEALDSAFEKLTTIYNAMNIQCTQYGPSFQTSNSMYMAACTFGGNVDKRGVVFR